MDWNDGKDVTRADNLRNSHLHGIYNDDNLDQKQFLHGSEEYKQYFEEECGRTDHVHLDKTPKIAIGLPLSTTDPRLIEIKTIHSEGKRYTSG